MIAKIDIEESAKYTQYGIIAFTDGTYYKPKKLSDSEKKENNAEYELIPLTSEEKKQYGIEETEHGEKVISDDGFEIEESETEPSEEEKKKKQNVTIMGSPESVKAAREMLEKEIQRRNLGEQSETDDLSSLKLKMYQKFNKNPMFLDATSKSQLSAMVENHVNNTQRENEQLKRGTPAGSPLVEQQYGVKDDLYTHKFSSMQELIDTLTEKSKTSNEAKSYLDEYWRQAVQAMKSNQTPIPIPNRNDPQNMPPLRDEHGYKVLANPERDSDIQSLQARWRRERLKRMGIKTEGE